MRIDNLYIPVSHIQYMNVYDIIPIWGTHTPNSSFIQIQDDHSE